MIKKYVMTSLVVCIIMLGGLCGQAFDAEAAVIDAGTVDQGTNYYYFGKMGKYGTVWNGVGASLASQGYSCNMQETYYNSGDWRATCVRKTKSSKKKYEAKKDVDDQRALIGYGDDYVTTYTDTLIAVGYNSPFLYLQNPPEGNISVNINSERSTYYPKPHFNQKNGWLVESNGNFLSVNGKVQDHLFYELEVSKVTLNRNGENFSSKEEIIAYLTNSDFLTKLGFSEEEKKNSLSYFIPKLKESKDQNYYYLTILNDKAINDISQLTIDPHPKNIIRQYFAVYPTSVPVRTNGTFIFPQRKSIEGFTVKETGELLIEEPMQIFFE